MALYLRNGIWWIDYEDARGKRKQRSLKTRDKTEAQQLHDRILNERWHVKELGEKQRRTWEEAAVQWCKDKSHKKSYNSDLFHLNLLDKYLGGIYLDKIDKELIEEFKSDRIKDGVKNSTINRSLALIRSILRAAQNEWEWLDKVPNIKLLEEPKGRVRWLKPAEIDRLLKELPPHLKDMVLFTLATGLRESNVTQLKWDQIDLNRSCAWVNADEIKNGRALAVPLNDLAITVIRAQIGKHLTHVFTYDGHPVTRANNHAWRKALKRARIEDFRWHDLRHCWATNHIQNNTPLHILQELGGWESSEMVKRYAHLSADQLLGYAQNTQPKLRLVK